MKWVAAVAAINGRKKQPKDEEADTKLQSAFSPARKLQKDVQESRRVAQCHVYVVHELGLQPGPGYVHAKMMIIDDEVLHVGSSNINNRSLRLDTECDVTIDARSAGNESALPRIRALRDRLPAEHLGVQSGAVAAAIEGKGSLIGAIDGLLIARRSLRRYEMPEPQDVERWLADNQVLDPEGAEEVFEAMTRGGLLSGLRRRLCTRMFRIQSR